MVIFVFPVFVGTIDPEINRNYRRTVSPDGWDQVDALNNPVMLPAPVPGDQFDLMWIGFVKGTIIDYEYTFVSLDQPFRFVI